MDVMIALLEGGATAVGVVTFLWLLWALLRLLVGSSGD